MKCRSAVRAHALVVTRKRHKEPQFPFHFASTRTEERVDLLGDFLLYDLNTKTTV